MTEEEDGARGPFQGFRGLHGGEEGDSRRMRWFKFLFPLLFTAAIIFVVFLMLPFHRWLAWGGLAFFYIIPPAGKESIIPTGVAAGFHPLAMAGTILLMDFVCALFIAWNFPFAKKIPVLGRYIHFVESKGSGLLEGNPALRAGAWVGLVLFVTVPFQGSGGVTASIIGRAVGMRTPYVVTSVAVGAITSGLIIAYAAYTGVTLIAYDMVLGIIVIMLLLLAIALTVLVFRLVRIRRWERMDNA